VTDAIRLERAWNGRQSLRAGGGAEVVDDATLRRLVAVVRDQVSAIADAERRGGAPLAAEQRAVLAEEVTAAWLQRDSQRRIRHNLAPLAATSAQRLRHEVRAALSPLGPVARFLDDPAFSDVEVNGAANVVCTERGSDRRTEHASPFASDGEAFDWVAEQAALGGRRFDEANPSVRFRLPNGVRVHAIAKVTSAPTSTSGCSCRAWTPSTVWRRWACSATRSRRFCAGRRRCGNRSA